MKIKILLLGILFFVFGCSGFNQGDSFGGKLLSNLDESLDANVNYKLVVQTGPYQGRTVVNDIENSKLNLVVPIGMNQFVPTGPFTQGSVTGQILADSLGYKTLSVQIPTSYISQGVSAPWVSQLPNGDPLDFLTSGQAQRLSFPLDNQNTAVASIYFHPPYGVGAFIQTPFDLGTLNHYPVVIKDSLIERGFISTYPHRSSLKGGTFVFISLPQ